MHPLFRTVLLALFLALAPMPALASDGAPPASNDPHAALESASQALIDRVFVLEHQLHALEAELMALRARLAALETCADA